VKRDYQILTETPIYRGFFNLTAYRIKHSLFEGGWSDDITRELFHRGACVAVLPYDPKTEQVILIEQFRIGAVGSKPEPWLLEIVAGAIEPGESHEDVARRETLEEAGCTVDRLIRIGEFFTSPGGCSEKVTVYCGLLDATQAGGIFGLDEEHEDIRASVVPLDEALSWLASGVIDSAVPALALQWLALNRASLRERIPT
jgi:ADP-ribose pyrophosphatase